MAMSCLETDLTVLFGSSDFGETDGAVRNGDTASPIPGIFDDEDVERENGEGVTIIQSQITFTCASSKVPSLADGDVMSIRGVDYNVRYWEDDGSGVVVIYMEGPDP